MNLKKRNRAKVDLSTWYLDMFDDLSPLDKWVKKKVSVAIDNTLKEDPPNIRYHNADKMTLIVGIPLSNGFYGDVEYKCSLLDLLKYEFEFIDEDEINNQVDEYEKVLLKLLKYIRSQKVKVKGE